MLHEELRDSMRHVIGCVIGCVAPGEKFICKDLFKEVHTLCDPTNEDVCAYIAKLCHSNDPRSVAVHIDYPPNFQRTRMCFVHVLNIAPVTYAKAFKRA